MAEFAGFWKRALLGPYILICTQLICGLFYIVIFHSKVDIWMENGTISIGKLFWWILSHFFIYNIAVGPWKGPYYNSLLYYAISCVCIISYWAWRHLICNLWWLPLPESVWQVLKKVSRLNFRDFLVIKSCCRAQKRP